MMAPKHLHELLREDQEPFQLKNFISDRRSQLKSPSTTTALKRKSINQPTRNFCFNHACLSTFQDSPSPATKISCNNARANNAAVFLHVPSKTSTMLRDAAVRVQSRYRENAGFGLFGSFLKRLKNKSTLKKRREINSGDAVAGLNVDGGAYEQRFLGRLSSADWSEKSSESETSCSSISVHELNTLEGSGLSSESDKCFCSSPFSFSLHKSSSPGCRTPEFLSPATSPSRLFLQENSQEINVEAEEQQCSPVSVLDPRFEDDHEHEDGVVGMDHYDRIERTKHQLLQKLHRFERLVGLDPISLEKHMVEMSGNNEDNDYEDLGSREEKEETANDEFMRDILNHLGIDKIPLHMKRLVLDLIAEENKKDEHEECEALVKRVCRRLDSWKRVESNTIDMMVEFEFRREKNEGWKKDDDGEKVREIGMNIEVAIMDLLVNELAQELISFFGD